MELIMTMVNKSKTDAIQYCKHCLLSSADDPNIMFDQQGVCSFCNQYKRDEAKNVKLGAQGQQELVNLVEQIKAAGRNNEYDCILGLSGGVDSTYLALVAKRLGLRPLAVHFDNGWNSELAVHNIENIIEKLNYHLHTEVIDWDEFKDLQLAFLKASVVDIEMITDHAIIASLYKLAIRHNIKFILSGVNYVTESILPPSWIHDKRDHVHIRAIHERFGKLPLKKFPLLNSFLKWKVEWHGIRSVALLNYFPYVKSEVKTEITKELQWRDYGGKHYESVFTRFYQGYILPEKFGIDKRKAHLSNLICAGQITRDQALEELSKPVYPPQLFKSDYDFVLKKLELSRQEFEAIMRAPVKRHEDYPVDKSIYMRFPVLQLVAPFWRALKQLRRR